MEKVFIEPLNKTIEVEKGSNLREALINSGIEITSPCGGCASCTKCVIIVKSGGESLSDIEFTEKQMIGNVFHLTGERLSCQAKVLGSVHIDISAHIPEPIKKESKIVHKTRSKVVEEREERKAERDAKPPKEGGWYKPKSFKYSDED